MAYDTTTSGLSAAGARQSATISDAKAGSPKGASGTYTDKKNTASPDEGTIARNFVNSHSNGQTTARSTSDTGREKP